MQNTYPYPAPGCLPGTERSEFDGFCVEFFCDSKIAPAEDCKIRVTQKLIKRTCVSSTLPSRHSRPSG